MTLNSERLKGGRETDSIGEERGWETPEETGDKRIEPTTTDPPLRAASHSLWLHHLTLLNVKWSGFSFP